MMLTKYKTSTYYSNKIEAVEIVKETEHTVTIPTTKGRREHRENKESSWHKYHDSWAAAHAYLLAGAQRQVERAEEATRIADENLAAVVAMREPKA